MPDIVYAADLTEAQIQARFSEWIPGYRRNDEVIDPLLALANPVQGITLSVVEHVRAEDPTRIPSDIGLLLTAQVVITDQDGRIYVNRRPEAPYAEHGHIFIGGVLAYNDTHRDFILSGDASRQRVYNLSISRIRSECKKKGVVLLEPPQHDGWLYTNIDRISAHHLGIIFVAQGEAPENRDLFGERSGFFTLEEIARRSVPEITHPLTPWSREYICARHAQESSFPEADLKK